MTHRQRLLAAVFGAALSVPAAAQDMRGIQALLDQANYWRLQNRPELVIRTLERVLAADPRNLDALAQSAQAQAQLGNRAAAEALLSRLRQIAPNDPRLSETDVTVRAATVDQGALAEARRLAQTGRTAEAVQRYRDLFRGAPVPDVYAVEFFQTLAGTEGGFEEARTGLTSFANRNPADTRGQLALAQVLTFRDSTRADGIRRLRQLADNPEASNTAIAAWRQALLWQGASRANVPELEAFLQRFPNDTAVAQRLEESRNPPPGAGDEGGLARIRGFEALNRGQIAAAEREFQAALALNANDADALGGIGLVRLRQGRFGDARSIIERAIAADPEARARYGRALDGAAGSAELASARSALQRGDLATAEANLRRAIQRESTDRADAEALLGDIALRRGDLQGAEQRYRAALARRPNLGQAASGLYEVQQQQGRFAEAEDIQRRLGIGLGGDPATTRSNALRQEAQRAADPAQQAQLLAEAVRVDPNNPWARLDLARLLASVGRNAEGRQIVEGPALQTGSPEALFAAALFAESDNRPSDATALISRVPDRLRSADMQRLLQRTRVLAEADQALALYNAGRRAEGRQLLVSIASRRDPTGASASAALRAFSLVNDRQGAVEAGRAFLANNPNATGSARVAVAGSLLGAGATEEANLLARTLETAPGLSAEDRRQAAAVQTGLAIRQADRLNERGDQAAAFDALAPALQRDPGSVPANLALARLYQGAGQPRQAQAITEGILQRDPTSLDARLGAVEAAISARDFGRAEALLVEARAFNPNDPRVSLLEARIARANGNSSRALRALELAAEQRRAQGFVPDTPVQDGTVGTFDNPFRRLSRAGAIGGASAFQNDPLSNDIARELTAVRDETAARLQGGLGFRTRTGTSGFDRLEEYSAPVDMSFSPPRLGGRVTLSMTPTNINSGQIDTTNLQTLRNYGYNAIAPALSQQQQNTQVSQAVRDAFRARDTSASGIGLGLAYSRGAFSADIGTSPIGFRRQNILGGIEIAPAITNNFRIRLIAEQRSVTDSLLSWSGARDPSTGRTWGGVVRTGGRVQFEYVTGPLAVYMLGGYSAYTGTNTARNNRFEVGAGAQYALWRLPDEELTLGLDLVYFGFDNNQRLFSFGNGGYFSPQSYFSAGIPIDYRRRSGNLAWRIGGTIGYQSFREDTAPFFPRDALAQAQLESQLQGQNSTGIRAVQPGQSQSGVIGGLRGDIEYAVTPNFRIGGLLRYERTGNWEEARGLVFARYRFDR
jgi:Tfp pilus assembly protein PilF